MRTYWVVSTAMVLHQYNITVTLAAKVILQLRMPMYFKHFHQNTATVKTKFSLCLQFGWFFVLLAVISIRLIDSIFLLFPLFIHRALKLASWWHLLTQCIWLTRVCADQHWILRPSLRQLWVQNRCPGRNINLTSNAEFWNGTNCEIHFRPGTNGCSTWRDCFHSVSEC